MQHSFYMAAIEDAIVLDVDTINLSLGSANPGLSFNKTYQAILDELANSDTVVTISSGNALPEGTKVNYSLILIPEYYADENGEYDVDTLTDGDLANGELGQGAYLTTSLTIDNTAPEILSAAVEGSILTVTAKDSRYVACLAAFSSDGAGPCWRRSFLTSRRLARRSPPAST